MPPVTASLPQSKHIQIFLTSSWANTEASPQSKGEYEREQELSILFYLTRQRYAFVNT